MYSRLSDHSIVQGRVESAGCWGGVCGDRHHIKRSSNKRDMLHRCQCWLLEQKNDLFGVKWMDDLLLEFTTADHDDVIVWSRWRLSIRIQRARYDEFKLP